MSSLANLLVTLPVTFKQFQPVRKHENVYKKIKQHGNRLNKLLKITISALYIGSLMFFPWFSDEDVLYLPIKIYKLYFGKFATFFSAIFYILTPHHMTSCMISTWFILYVANHLKFQLYILNNDLEMLAKYCRESGNCEQKQKQILESLKSCIQQHQIIKM